MNDCIEEYDENNLLARIKVSLLCAYCTVLCCANLPICLYACHQFLLLLFLPYVVQHFKAVPSTKEEYGCKRR